jgi:hypothetical protein
MTALAQFATAHEPGPKLVAYQTHPRPLMPIVAGSVEREWMEDTAARFAYRCLPLLIANQSGWLVLNSHEIRVTWDGSEGISGVAVAFPGGSAPFPASSHFGHGIVTWRLPWLFRTPPGYNLLVRGPANWPKDGAYALEGVVETDWSVANFTMNWKLTRPGVTITFAKDEPVCMIVPQRRGEIESFDPQIRGLEEDPELALRSREWAESRRRFINALSSPGPAETWQKHYFRGTTPDGWQSEGHQTRLKLRQFSHSANRSSSRAKPDYVPGPEKAFELTKEAEMPFEPLKATDLTLVNQVLQTQPGLQNTISLVRQVSAKAKYPIANFAELQTALGGANATLSFGGRTMTMAEASSSIPSYYFPIASESDLISKVTDLTTIPPLPATAKWGLEKPKTAGRTPPKIDTKATPLGRPGTEALKLG